MTDRPIIFSAPMVRSLLAGTKTQTRRVLSNDRFASLFNGTWTDSYVLDPGNADWREREVRYAVGDRLWVREAWNIAFKSQLAPGEVIERTSSECSAANRGFACAVGDGIVYRATGAQQHPEFGKALWRSPLHLSRWASRLTLIVTDVRVQRLMEITNEDCIAEGIPVHPNKNAPRVGPVIDDFARQHGLISHYGAAYRNLWDSLNASRGYGWEANPWVAAISFTVEHRNIDALEVAA